MEGYYDGTIFHRVVKDFIVQGGDPTGTGTGGESIYGQPFKDEFHQRLRFVRRGLVAMANSGLNDNGSQFFITLGQTPELQNKHTVFGKVGGNTVYNLPKLGDVEVDRDDRPLYPARIVTTEVLGNPYDDIIPRSLARRKEGDERKHKSRSKATKNFSLLSFGEEAEEEEEALMEAAKERKVKSKSAHDLANDDRLSSVPAVETSEHVKRRGSEGEEAADEEEEDKVSSRIRKKLKKDVVEEEGHEPVELFADEKKKRKAELESLKKEAKELRKELKRERAGAPAEEKPEVAADTNNDAGDEGDNEMLADIKRQRNKYKQQKKQLAKDKGAREQQTLALLKKFQQKLQEANEPAADDDSAVAGGGDDDDDDNDDDNDEGWMHHRLEFEAHEGKVRDVNVHEADAFEISDPRNPINQRRREASKQKLKEKAW
ncbi:PREDICTED: peptidyl-prolyl cis-trans isomerase CWC27 homolog [Priapulus caudatus]|uniref:Spliceosome-associated protein CWC27 homolog n=1 Tax=Priapulus caudatus TaxID=37621 RepID=A0ABM1ESU0_PRICU|nr:PREDICTED: peptidyl-prolyl cis-trans isomerase CWC27 homolog [Priapulus caudatus]